MKYKITECPVARLPKQIRFDLENDKEYCQVRIRKTAKNSFNLMLLLNAQTTIEVKNIPELDVLLPLIEAK